MPTKARLRIHGEGNVEVSLARAYLDDLEGAYNALVTFEAVMEQQARFARRMLPDYLLSPNRFGLLLSRNGRVLWDWPATPDQIEAAVPASEVLVLAAVQLASPGFWDFIGIHEVLEVIRKYLQDRHERRKDKDYKEDAERRKLDLENLQLENTVLADRIKIAKELGATNRDLAPLINHLVGRPLRRLDKHQDRGVIGTADIVDKL